VQNLLLNGMEHIQTNFREETWKIIDENIDLDKCKFPLSPPPPPARALRRADCLCVP
jgi:hypothetical protein